MPRSLQTGWYISPDEHVQNDYEDTTIYLCKAGSDVWSIVGSGEVISVDDLPVKPRRMFMLRPVRIY